MKKVTSILIMLVSVLTMWGQEVEFKHEDAVKQVAQLKNFQPTILEQARASSKINDADKAQAEDILNDTFQKLDAVLSVYSQIEQDPQLKFEAQNIIVDFIKNYETAILDDKRQNIKVSTRNFINVAEEASPKFDAFYTKAREYINSHPSESIDETPALDSTEQKEKEQYEYYSEPEYPSSRHITTPNSGFFVLVWVPVLIGIVSGILSIIALVKVSEVHKRINHRKSDLLEAERRINEKISEIKSSKVINTSPASNAWKPNPSSNPPQFNASQNCHEENLPPVIAVTRKKNEQRPKVEKRKATTSLYATIKAQSSFAEFFKVTQENSGDKVFMLTLANPDVDVAEFTIVPDMSPDFMKSVIVDRDTYLPALFCEKSIESANPTRIEVCSVGRAKKVNEKWQVEERMSIRLV